MIGQLDREPRQCRRFETTIVGRIYSQSIVKNLRITVPMFTEFPIKSAVAEIRCGAQKLAQLALRPAFPGYEQLLQIIKTKNITVTQHASRFRQSLPQRSRQTT